MALIIKYILPLIILFTFIFAQDTQTATIITTDGSEIIGDIIEETDIDYKVQTPAGLTITIPKEAVLKIEQFKGAVKEGKVFRPDPNRSLYLFSPSAYPICKSNKYCRDFCVLFPSFNYGISNILSAQASVFWFPELDIEDIPILGSLKASIYNNYKFALAGGAMYVRIPTISLDDGDDLHLGGGFVFITGTYGDQLNHATLSLGLGFARGNDG